MTCLGPCQIPTPTLVITFNFFIFQNIIGVSVSVSVSCLMCLFFVGFYPNSLIGRRGQTRTYSSWNHGEAVVSDPGSVVLWDTSPPMFSVWVEVNSNGPSPIGWLVNQIQGASYLVSADYHRAPDVMRRYFGRPCSHIRRPVCLNYPSSL